VSNRRVFGGLGASHGFFAVAVNIVIDGAIQAEGAKLNGGPVDLVTVTRHANSFTLIKHAPRVVDGCASRRLCGSVSGSLVLLL